MEQELVLAVAVGMGLGMGLLVVIQMVVRWDGQRRLAAELAERNRHYRDAAQQANRRPERRRPPADMTGPVPPAPEWDGNGQRRAPWEDPRAENYLPAPGPWAARPYTDGRRAPVAGKY